MKVFNKEEIAYVLGGNWVTLPDGTRIYVESDDEEGEDDDFIFV